MPTSRPGSSHHAAPPNPVVERIRAAAQQDAECFAARVADSALEAAADIWLSRVAGRTLELADRKRLVKAVEQGEADETRDIQLTRAALLRKAGLDERSAAAAAIAAGASYTMAGAVLGMTQQGASARFGPYVAEVVDNTDRARA